MKIWAVVLCVSFMIFFVAAICGTFGTFGTFHLKNDHLMTMYIGFSFGGLLTALGALK